MLTAAPPSDFEQFARRASRAMDEFIRRRSPQFRAIDAWTPAVNAYRLEDRIEVCVDLAGVKRDTIDLRVEPGRLTIRGVRQTPLPARRQQQAPHILVMEIDHGPFERSLVLPHEVRIDRVSADQTDGLLWVRLPLRSE